MFNFHKFQQYSRAITTCPGNAQGFSIQPYFGYFTYLPQIQINAVVFPERNP
jgi:hypothetical protein